MKFVGPNSIVMNSDTVTLALEHWLNDMKLDGALTVTNYEFQKEGKRIKVHFVPVPKVRPEPKKS